ncbi:16S rRNA pseudouridine(516) synthase [Piscinibacter sakaiensis]|uniref:16S rRNA pseudouridine(516) synthase n=1 Tax=Piscinibacter sakaiensis TaxID=1547922 RepID=UPI0006B49675|nr:16S rRNA pseudouridine(516) synthase [Piscinibacter sakaiensis]
MAAILFDEGFGTRRECARLVRAGAVALGDRLLTDPWEPLAPDGLVLQVRGEPWPVQPGRALVLLHKPAGYECSQKPRHHPSVLSLLPAPLRQRGVQPVGRLDEDTTGLLLLTDDGALIHRWTSPKHHLPKVYEVTLRHPLDADQLQRLADGVVLDDDPRPVRAVACTATGERALRLTLAEGRYHQVKRMLAAVGNRVEALHRSGFGALVLPADLAPGQWRRLPGPQPVDG